MSERLAKKVLGEVPVNQLQQIVAKFSAAPKDLAASDGGCCGLDCPGSDGYVCGLDCTNVSRTTVGVVDRTNVTGITKPELLEARAKVLQFKDTLLAQARVAGITLK